MNSSSIARLCKKHIFPNVGLIAIFFALILLTSCGDDFGKSAGEKAAKIISEVVPDLTNESAQWRALADEALKKLPEEFRHQFDLAFSRAIGAAQQSVMCTTDFFRDRLIEDLNNIKIGALGGTIPPKRARICDIWPGPVIELDQDYQPKDARYIEFGGYNFDNGNVRVLLQYKDGQTDDLTDCCLDNPTYYSWTVDLDEIPFSPMHRRIILQGAEGSNSVAINEPPPIKKMFTYKIDLKTGSADYASAGDHSEVWIKIYGTKGTAGETNVSGNFRRNETASRVFTVEDLGDVKYMTVRYVDRDNNAWQLDSIVITNVTTNQVIWTNRCDKNFGHQNPNENTCP